MKKLGKLTLNDLKESLAIMENEELENHTGGSFFISMFELDCFDQYVWGIGDMNLSEVRFEDIADAAETGSVLSTSWVEIDGTMYEKKVISLYNNSAYDQALGTSTFYYDSCGTAVGMKDTYDFNSMSEGERSSFDEDLTTAGGLVPGQAYDITYGIND